MPSSAGPAGSIGRSSSTESCLSSTGWSRVDFHRGLHRRDGICGTSSASAVLSGAMIKAGLLGWIASCRWGRQPRRGAVLA